MIFKTFNLWKKKTIPNWLFWKILLNLKIDSQIVNSDKYSEIDVLEVISRSENTF